MRVDFGMLATPKSIMREIPNKEHISTDIQPFKFPDVATKSFRSINSSFDLLLSGSENPSLADAKQTSESKVILTDDESSNRHI